MASSSRKKTTMAKLNREAAVRERRARKKAKKDARKLAALVPDTGETSDTPAGDEDLNEPLPLGPGHDAG
jgi:hypothetical protein